MKRLNKLSKQDKVLLIAGILPCVLHYIYLIIFGNDASPNNISGAMVDLMYIMSAFVAVYAVTYCLWLAFRSSNKLSVSVVAVSVIVVSVHVMYYYLLGIQFR